MKYLRSNKMISKFFSLSLLLMLAACSAASSPTRYYILETNSLDSSAFLQKNTGLQKQGNRDSQQSKSALENQKGNIVLNKDNIAGPLIAISPVSIPSYLNRPQLVTRTGDVGLSINESQRWGEGLPVGIARVLSDSLTVNLEALKISAIPLRVGISPDYTLQVDIRHFEGKLNGSLSLSVLWSLRDKKQRIWQANYENTVNTGGTYSEYVQAYASLVDQFGKEVSRVFRDLYMQK